MKYIASIGAAYALSNHRQLREVECIDGSATDMLGLSCKDYANGGADAGYCGKYDSDRFVANKECCACKALEPVREELPGLEEIGRDVEILNPECYDTEKCIASVKEELIGLLGTFDMDGDGKLQIEHIR